MGKSQKSYVSIRSKLLAAVAMLLVASFMVVSSTYAWFTLSTAPEVTGIQTRIGANGSLEIALVYDATIYGKDDTAKTVQELLNGITSSVGDANKTTLEKNATWGNIVDLSAGALYGLDLLSLMPARLNALAPADAANGTWTLAGSLATSPLVTPDYGSDGRVSALKANVITGAAKEGAFNAGGYGVRALGVASAMSAQQLGYRNAREAINNAINNALADANASLRDNSTDLATLLIKHLAVSGTDTQTYDITGIGKMLTSLAAANVHVAEAIKANVQAAVATAYEADSVIYTNLNAALAGVDAIAVAAKVSTLDRNVTNSDGLVELSYAIDDANTLSIAIKPAIVDAAKHWVDMGTKIESATDLYTAAGTGEGGYTAATWSGVSAVLQSLVNLETDATGSFRYIDLNGQVNQQGVMDNIINIMKEGATINLNAGSGLYYDMAMVCGNIRVHVPGLPAGTIVKGIDIGGMEADIQTKCVGAPTISIAGAITDAPAEGDQSAQNLTDFYGYAIDLAFRTNATNSNLQLQTAPVNRIYSEGGSAETMGHGSTMTFIVDNSVWGYVGEGGDTGDALAMQQAAESVARLMTAIRIVFTDATGKIIGQAKLDITLDDPTTTEQNEANWATKQKDGNTVIEAPIRLYNVTYTQDETNGGTLVEYGTVMPTAVDNDGAQTLMPLVQNTATMLSTYVYLDGDMVDNSMVANGASSMTGTLNLQFSSSAALDPMDYTPLKDQGGSSTTASSATEQTTAPSSSEEANG
jgi:hypothetical protein